MLKDWTDVCNTAHKDNKVRNHDWVSHDYFFENTTLCVAVGCRRRGCRWMGSTTCAQTQWSATVIGSCSKPAFNGIAGAGCCIGPMDHRLSAEWNDIRGLANICCVPCETSGCDFDTAMFHRGKS